MDVEKREWIISIYPEIWQLIWTGEKRFEYRRRRLSVLPGDQVVIYVTKPVGLVMGSFLVGRVLMDAPMELCDHEDIQASASLRTWLSGCKVATALEITELYLQVPEKPWFHPPQGVVRSDRVGIRRE